MKTYHQHPPTTMKILSWNVRGLRKSRTHLAIRKVLYLHQPQILFYCETKMMVRHVNLIYRSFNFANCFAVDRNGLGGGLTMLWGADINVNITSYRPHHIDAIVSSESDLVWRCTGIYGQPELNQKHNTWTLLKRLANLFSHCWCCFRDFNEVIHMYEKNGGNEKNVNVIVEFREVVGYKGYPYTWFNKRFGVNYIEE